MTADASRLRDGLMRWANIVQSDAVDAVPDLVRPLAPLGVPSDDPSYTPGKLRETITVTGPVSGGGSQFRGRVSAGSPQAVWTDEGTSPHVIVPVRAKVLRFTAGGATVFTMKVNHPGNPAQHWWEPAVRQAYGQALLAAAVARDLNSV